MICLIEDVTRESVIDLINRRFALMFPEAKTPLGSECVGELFSSWECCDRHRKLRIESESLYSEARLVNRVIGFCADTDGSLFSAN